jgi:hypothetical protein
LSFWVFGVFGLSSDGRENARFAIGKMYNCLTTIEILPPPPKSGAVRNLVLMYSVWCELLILEDE